MTLDNYTRNRYIYIYAPNMKMHIKQINLPKILWVFHNTKYKIDVLLVLFEVRTIAKEN